MATQEFTSTQLEKIVSKPTWKQVLLDLIVGEELDPWNVDIIKISDGFMMRIKEMKKIDLFLPANLILASAILLRYKSEVIQLEDDQPEPPLDPTDGEPEEPEIIPELSLSSRIPPRRPVTLEELMGEIESVMIYEEKRGQIKKEKIEQIINLKIDTVDIEKKMSEVYDLILGNMNGNNFVLFSKLINKKTKKEQIYTLLSILHLTQKNKLDIEQKKIFEDITIRTIKTKN